MQNFGKRQYAHMELDPWAKKQQRETRSRESATPVSRIAGYIIAFVAVGALAFAGFEMLVLA